MSDLLWCPRCQANVPTGNFDTLWLTGQEPAQKWVHREGRTCSLCGLELEVREDREA